MFTVLLVVQCLVALALIGVVLLQRSEGGALGMGGGGSGGFMTGRGAANFLTRVTTGLAIAFFATSLLLTMVANRSGGPRSVLEGAPTVEQKVPSGESKPSSLPPIDFSMPESDKPKVPQSK